MKAEGCRTSLFLTCEIQSINAGSSQKAKMRSMSIDWILDLLFGGFIYMFEALL